MNEQVASSFVKAQIAFGPALKTNTNPHFKSRYADLSACVEAVIDSLNKNGFALIQNTHPDETGVTVETLFLHSSGESISGGRLHVPAPKNDPQGYGSALTYARRYSLMCACGIAPEDDDGNGASKKKKDGPQAPITPSTGAGDNIEAGRKESLDRLSATITECFDAGQIKDAMDCLHDITEADEKVYLWAQLDSKVRSAIKRVQKKAA